MAETTGVFIKPLVLKDLDQYVDGYGNKRAWRKYNKSLNVAKLQVQPNPFQKSITFRALVRSEEERDPNNSIGAVKNTVRRDGTIRKTRKRPAPKRHIQYLVTIRFHELEFKDKESKQFNQEWKVAGRTSFSRTPSVKNNRAMLRCQCFTGDTLVRHWDGGIHKIKDLVGKQLDTLSWDEQSKYFVKGHGYNVQSYGFQDVLELTFSKGEKVKATYDHKVLLEDETWKRADELVEGDKIKSFGHPVTFVSSKHHGNEEVFCLTVEHYGNFSLYIDDKSSIIVKNCRDFMFTFEKPLAENGGLWPNNRWTQYQRLTPKGTGYPERNPNEKMGYCKHVATFLRYLNDSGFVSN